MNNNKSLDFSSKNNGIKSAIKHSIAASLASCIEQILHPLEVIKTRLQSHDGQIKNNVVPKYKGITNASIEIMINEGLRGLYRGVLINFIATNIAKTIYFGIYGERRSKYINEYGKNSQFPTFMASTEAAVLTTFLTSPFWVIRTRVLLNTNRQENGIQSLKRVIVELHNQYGIAGFYRGMMISLALCSQGIIQLIVYENFKKLMDYEKGHGVFVTMIPAYGGMISKFIASLLTYPLSLIRTRLQQNQYIEVPSEKYKNSFDIAQKTFKKEGFRGFYKGFLPGTLRALPANAVFFFSYEFFLGILPI